MLTNSLTKNILWRIELITIWWKLKKSKNINKIFCSNSCNPNKSIMRTHLFKDTTTRSIKIRSRIKSLKSDWILIPETDQERREEHLSKDKFLTIMKKALKYRDNKNSGNLRLILKKDHIWGTKVIQKRKREFLRIMMI